MTWISNSFKQPPAPPDARFFPFSTHHPSLIRPVVLHLVAKLNDFAQQTYSYAQWIAHQYDLGYSTGMVCHLPLRSTLPAN